MQVNGYQHFESQKSIYKQNKINPCDFWRYIEVLWSETIGLCKKLNIIYNIITCNKEPQATGKYDSFSQTDSFGQFDSMNDSIH